MCDATTLLSSKQTDLHSCWIIYTKGDGKERLTVTDAKPMLPGNSAIMNSTNATASTPNATNSSDATDSESDDNENDGPDQQFHKVLDPELQPEEPISDNPESQKIYRDHRRLAKKYLLVDTNLYYAQATKDELLVQMDPVEKEKKIKVLQKIREKDDLLGLYNDLKQQLDKMQTGEPVETSTAHLNNPTAGLPNAAQPGEVVADDGWVVIASNQNT